MNEVHNLDYIVGRIELLLKPLSSDDDVVLLDLIRDEVLVQRGLLVNQVLMQRLKVDGAYYQRYCCAPISCELIGCDGEEIESGYYEVKIPTLISRMPQVIRSVGREEFNYTYVDSFTDSEESFPYMGNSALPAYEYTIKDSQTLLLNKLYSPMQKNICVEAIYSNPQDEQLGQCLDDELFPIPVTVMGALERMVVQAIATRYYSAADELNNNSVNQSNNKR